MSPGAITVRFGDGATVPPHRDECCIRRDRFANGECGVHNVRIAGYADDTTIYTNNQTDRDITTEVLQQYGAVAGLQVNATKTVLLPATAEHAVTATSCKVAERTAIIRYLGIPFMLQRDERKIWHHIMAQVRVRLTLALRKTSNVIQRAQLAAAIIVAKVTFVCRHEWPSKVQVATMQRFLNIFVWNGHFDTEDRSRSWLKATLAYRSLNDGGIGLPNPRSHLMALATTTVYHQANIPPYLRVAHSRALAHNCAIQPHGTNLTAPKSQATMLETGARVIACTPAAVRSDATIAAITSAHSSLRAMPLSHRHWQRERLWVDTTMICPDLNKVLRGSRSDHGRLNAAWLQLCDVGVGAFLLMADATELTKTHISELGAGNTISQLIHWRWESHNLISFAPCGIAYPMSNKQDAQFNALLANYPEILSRPAPPNQLMVDSGVDLEYSVYVRPSKCTLHIHEWPDPQPIKRIIHTASHASMWDTPT